MSDTTWGQVRSVFAADMLEIRVTHEGTSNMLQYGPFETICIASISLPELTDDPAVDLVRKKLRNKRLRCSIQGRNRGRVLVADVSAL